MLTTEQLDNFEYNELDREVDCVYYKDTKNCYKKLRTYYLASRHTERTSLDRLCKKHIKLALKDFNIIEELTTKDIIYLRLTGKIDEQY